MEKTKKAPIHKENDHLWSLDRRAAKCVITVPLYISDADINKSHCCVNWKLAPPISLTFFLHAQKSSRPHWRHFWIHYINPSRTTNERSAHERQQTHVCLVFLSEVILFYNVPLVHPRPTYTVSHRCPTVWESVISNWTDGYPVIIMNVWRIWSAEQAEVVHI